MISNIVTITNTTIEIEPTGINKLLGFQGKIVIPLTHITEVAIDRGIMSHASTWRVLGTRFFSKSVGLFKNKDSKAYANIKGQETPLLIQLVDEHYQQLVLGVENPQAIIRQIEQQQAQVTRTTSEVLYPSKTYSKLYQASNFIYNLTCIAGVILLFMLLFALVSQRLLPELTQDIVKVIPYWVAIIVSLVVVSLLIKLIARRQRK